MFSKEHQMSVLLKNYLEKEKNKINEYKQQTTKKY
jgi:hypothetical protein